MRCRIASKLLWNISPLLTGVAILYAAHAVELKFMPVVEDFKVLSAKRVDDKVLISGTLNKLRDCEFVQLSAYADSTVPMIVTFLDNHPAAVAGTREVGYQLWGTWSLAAKGYSTIRLTVRHRCHPLWQQSAELAKLAVVTDERGVVQYEASR